MFHIIDKYLEVDGLSGDVTLYYNHDERELVALDAGLKYKRFKLLKDVEACTLAQKTAILKHRFVTFNAGLDLQVSDIFIHGEYVELLEVGSL